MTRISPWAAYVILRNSYFVQYFIAYRPCGFRFACVGVSLVTGIIFLMMSRLPTRDFLVRRTSASNAQSSLMTPLTHVPLMERKVLNIRESKSITQIENYTDLLIATDRT
jgi:uncharacterized membrane protein YbaN (DUF454 family)